MVDRPTVAIIATTIIITMAAAMRITREVIITSDVDLVAGTINPQLRNGAITHRIETGWET